MLLKPNDLIGQILYEICTGNWIVTGQKDIEGWCEQIGSLACSPCGAVFFSGNVCSCQASLMRLLSWTAQLLPSPLHGRFSPSRLVYLFNQILSRRKRKSKYLVAILESSKLHVEGTFQHACGAQGTVLLTCPASRSRRSYTCMSLKGQKWFHFCAGSF